MIFDTFLKIITVIGIPSTIVGLIYIGKKLQLLSTVHEEMKGLKKETKKEFKNMDKKITHISSAVIEIQGQLERDGYTITQKLLFTAQSPLKLTEYGEQVLEESGFLKIAKENKRSFIELVKSKNPQTNYDIQEYSHEVLKEFVKQNSPIVVPLKNYSYEKGLSLDFLLQTASLAVRDIVMQELTFDDHSLEEK